MIFGLVYLAYGPTVSLQREFIIILPLAIAILISTSDRFSSFTKQLLIGLMFGLAAIVKPHAVIGYPIVLLYLLSDKTIKNTANLPIMIFRIKNILFSIIGLLIPVLGSLIYLYSIDALSNFTEIISNYWPLYGDLTGTHSTIMGTDKILYLIRGFLNFGDNTLWMVAAAVGIYVALSSSKLDYKLKRQVYLLAGLAFAYSLYPVFAGKYWPYHWLLMQYFLILLSTLCLLGASSTDRFKRLYPLIIFIIILIPGIRPSNNMLYGMVMPDIINTESDIIKNRRAYKIAEYLQNNMEPGDLVQPLDWTGGAVHAMLIAKAKIATPFIYDFHFYHHVSKPYTQYLRQKFIKSLVSVKPHQ